MVTDFACNLGGSNIAKAGAFCKGSYYPPGPVVCYLRLLWSGIGAFKVYFTYRAMHYQQQLFVIPHNYINREADQ